MQLRLRVKQGTNAGREIKVPGDKFLIGRAEDCHLQPNSERVSRHHCLIAEKNGTITIRDLGSRNGTLVNGKKIIGEVEINNEDTLEVGPLFFDLILVVELKGEKKPVVQSVAEAAARTRDNSQPKANVDDWLKEFGDHLGPDDDTAVFDASQVTGEKKVRVQRFELPKPQGPTPEEIAAAEAAEKEKAKGNKEGTKAAAADAIRRMMRG